MIWRFIKVLVGAIIIFIIGNFLISNLDNKTLGYPLHFQFVIPPFWAYESVGFPVGFLILATFCLGMIFAAFIGAVSIFHRSRELKSKNRTIRELEKEIEELRSLYSAQRREQVSPNEIPSFASPQELEETKIE